MGKRGTKPKTSHELKILGGYRKDRHLHRGGSRPETSDPEQPENLRPLAAKLWDLVIKERSEWIGPADGPKLAHMCEVWDLMQRTLPTLQSDPTDKIARTAYVAYSTTFNKLSAAFGLSPGDRANLPEPEQVQQSETAQFLA